MKCVENTAHVCLQSHGGQQNKNLKKTPLCLWSTEIQPLRIKPCSGMQFGFQQEDL